ncbi:MAG: glycerol kinase GlpK [Rubricoccaceae bacterium]
MRYVLALDQGTTSSRALLFDRAGRVVAQAQRETTQHFPRPGWVEHDPQEIWATQVGVAAEALSHAGARPRDVAAIGLTNQRETTLVWDRRTGAPVYPAIVWQDRRTADACHALREAGHEATVRARTGLVLDPYFSATKVRWILDHVPRARADAEAGHLAFGTVDAWLVWKLTAGACHVTDVSNAARTLLFDIHRGVWDDDLLALFGVPRALLPEVRASSEVYAHASAEALAAPVPIGGIAGDQQAATFGQRCTAPGMAKNTYGTGCFALLQTGTEAVASRHHLLSTVAWRLGAEPPAYALEGSVFVAGAAVQWLRDGLGLIRSADEIEPLAASVPDTAGVHFVPAFTGLGAPHWDAHARGALLGLTRGTTRAHIARAALEGIAFQVADVLEAMARDAGRPVQELRVDGGAACNGLLMQLQADLLGVPLVRPAVTETTALGAAYLAGLAVGFWESEAEIDALWQAEARFEPAVSADERAARRAAWARALARVRT